MALREIQSTLPPGFGFYPSDEELVCHYLYKKVANERIAQGTLVEVDLHAHEPWKLPEAAKLTASEWYFFSYRDRKYTTGSRTNRATKTGYWKTTAKDREVRSATTCAIVGMRKTLVFYRGRGPNGVKAGWVMHEFRLDNPHSPTKEDWVICKVFQKSKGDSVGQDNTGASSPTFAGGSSHLMLDHPATMGGYYDLQQTGSSTGFAPQQDQVVTGGANAEMAQYSGALVHDHYRSFPQEVGGALPGFGTKGFRDEHGFNIFLDMGFEDTTTNDGGVRFLQGSN